MNPFKKSCCLPLFSMALLLVSAVNVSAQLSSIAWKAAEQLKRDRDNSVKYDDEGYVTELVIEDFPSSFLMGQLEVFPRLESVTIDSRYYFEDSNMGGIRKLNSLKKFAIRNSRYATSATLELLAEAPALESLEINECSEITNLHEISRIRRLKHLTIIPDDPLSFTPLVECKNLETVRLTDSESIDDSSIKDIARIKTLETVDLSGTAVTDEGLAELGSLPKLRALTLKNCDRLTGEAFSDFKYPESLRELNLVDASKITDDGLAALARFTELEQIRLHRNRAVQGAGFRFLGSTKKLKTLSCPDSAIADEHLKLLEGITTLEKIWLRDCPGVSGRGLIGLAGSKRCSQLNLNGCRKIDSPDFEVLATFKNLEELYIANTRIRNDRIELLNGLKKLRFLNISGNHWLNDEAFKKLKDSPVKKLVGNDLPRLTDDSFQWANEMKNLVNLSVTANQNLNGSGLQHIANDSRITHLTIESPRFLSLDGLRYIRQLPNIEELHFNDGEVAIAQLEQLAGMQNLRKLRYKVRDSDTGNERLISILNTFPNLD